MLFLLKFYSEKKKPQYMYTYINEFHGECILLFEFSACPLCYLYTTLEKEKNHERILVKSFWRFITLLMIFNL